MGDLHADPALLHDGPAGVDPTAVVGLRVEAAAGQRHDAEGRRIEHPTESEGKAEVRDGYRQQHGAAGRGPGGREQA